MPGPGADGGGDAGPDAGPEADGGGDAGPDAGADAGLLVLPPGPPSAPIVAEPRRWTWVPIEGAECMNGSPTGIGINPSTSTKKLLIVLEGGGACFNDTTCTVGTINALGFGPLELAAELAVMGYSGTLSRTLGVNVFAEWSYVFIPYCTGDVHAGANRSGPGGRHHVGFENIRLALARLVPTFPAAEQVVISGSSAGGFGAAYNFDQVQQAFAAVPVTLLDDSGPMMPDEFLKPCLQAQMRAAWGLDQTLPADCAACRPPNEAGLANYAEYLAAKYPDRRFGLISSTGDAVIRTFFGFGNSADCSSPAAFPAQDFEDGLVALRERMHPAHPNFRVYYPRSELHTWLLTDLGLYQTTSAVPLHAWVRDLVEGAPGWRDVP